MLFNSSDFLLIFLPLTLAAFYLVPPFLRLTVLLVSSLIFYGVAGLIPLLFMCLGIAWTYFLTLFIKGRRQLLLLIAAIAFPLWVLFMFRYLNFALDTVGAGEETRRGFQFFLSVLLPAGISFYTFQMVSYAIDVYDKSIPAERDAVKLATYIVLFPQLIAGPILRYSQISQQLSRIASQRRLSPDLVSGLKLLSIGMAGKIFAADVLGILHDKFDLNTSTSALDGVFSVFAYSFQIYFDFWAYSTIAIGLGKLFTIDLPRNFIEPYIAKNPKDFWRRWHVTLSYWLRDYVYIRLGGNQRYVLNIFIVFAACGLWHGAGWNFVVWGLYHAVLVSFYHVARPLWNRAPGALQIAVTFSAVSLGWPLFYLDLGQYFELMQLIAWNGDWLSASYRVRDWLFLGAILLLIMFARESVWLFNERRRTPLDWASVQSVLLFLCLIFFTWGDTFIYFRF